MPHSPYRTVIFILSTALSCLAINGCSGMPSQIMTQTDTNAAYEKKIVFEVNHLRTARGIGELATDTELTELARKYSREQANRNAIDHTDSHGKHLEDRLRKAGINNWIVAGENLAMNNAEDPAQQALRGWQLSNSHRDNLFSAEYNRTGVGICSVKKDGGKVNYITQIFIQQ